MDGAELLAAGSLILMARQEAGMSQDELAAAAGTSQPAKRSLDNSQGSIVFRRMSTWAGRTPSTAQAPATDGVLH